MSIPFRCTSCGRGLRANPELAGKKTKCPGCATVLVIPSAAEDDDHTPAPAPAKKPAAAAPAKKPAPAPAAKTPPATGGVVACECGTKIRTKPEWAGKVIKCPNCQERVKVPGGPAKPAPKRPTPPPPMEEDTFDMSGSTGLDDRPNTGYDDMSDDMSDDEPAVTTPSRKKAAPPAKKGGGKSILLATLLLLILGGGGFAGWFFFLRDPSPAPTPNKQIAQNKEGDEKKNPIVPAEPKEETPGKEVTKEVTPGTNENPAPVAPSGVTALDFVPGDALTFGVVRVSTFLKSPAGKQIQAMFDQPGDNQGPQEVLKAFGLTISDIQDIAYVAASLPMAAAADPGAGPPDLSGGPDGQVVIVCSSKPFDPKGLEGELMDQKLEKKETEGGNVFVVAGKKVAFALCSPNHLLFGDEKVVAKLLKGPPTQGLLTPRVKDAQAGNHLLFLGFQVPPELRAMATKSAPPAAQAMLPLAETNSGQLSVVETKGVLVNLKLHFPDADKAAKGKEAFDGLLGMGAFMVPQMTAGMKKQPGMEPMAKLVEEAFQSIKPAVAGTVVDVPMQINLTTGQIVAIALPAIMKMRDGAAGLVGLNNLKQIALAFHNAHDTFNHLPSAKQGAGLSWRVAILPFLEQNQLAKDFKMDEPWDSEHNKKFLELMPKVFEHPKRPAPPGHTYFRVFVGPEAIFKDGDSKQRLTQITDGTSNTLLIVEAAVAVPWTKFDEIAFDSKGELPKLGDPAKGGEFLGALVDGSVRLFRQVPPDVLKALITAAGGEVIDHEKLK